MALPTVVDVRDYLRIEDDTYALEITTITRLLAAAVGAVETFLGVPLAAGRTFAPASGQRTGWATVQSARSGNKDAQTSSVRSIAIRPLTEHPDFTARLEVVINQEIIDVVSEYYNRRNPSVASESEAGVSVTYVSEDMQKPVGLPPRVIGILRPIKNEITRWLTS